MRDFAAACYRAPEHDEPPLACAPLDPHPACPEPPLSPSPAPVASSKIAPFLVCLLLIFATLLATAGLWRSTRRVVPASQTAPMAARPRPRPLAPPAPIEPVAVLKTTPDRARAINATIPFVPGPHPSGRPFAFTGTAADRERAVTCLASAGWYEAGDDTVGQRAVVQVVLNRLRHPAYPKTVCGVVFQGSERSTGCQFTFTCDGALRRVPTVAGWKRAREVAEAALSGTVDKAVGTATHYHTDWVVPYWSGSLDKIAQVGTHIFLRWRGWWGTPAAFSGGHAGVERLDPRLFYLAGPAAETAAGDPMEAMADEATDEDATIRNRPALAVEGVSPRSLKGNVVRLGNAEGSEFGLELNRGGSAGYPAVAAALCKGKPNCIVSGWLRPELIPRALPVPIPALRTVSFLYRKSVQLGSEQVFWNCRQIPRNDPAQCLPGTQP